MFTYLQRNYTILLWTNSALLFICIYNQIMKSSSVEEMKHASPNLYLFLSIK
jgi:hypothetical protein